jgi:hypothetical protein
MSEGRFADICDKCQQRFAEYIAIPTCRSCGEDTCPLCDIPGERTEDKRNETLCRQCEEDYRLGVDLTKGVRV